MQSIPEGMRYAYHSTQDKHVNSIIENGIDSQEVNPDSEIIIDVLEELGYQDYFPFSRENVNYAHVETESIEYMFDQDKFNQDYAVVIIDITKIECPIYVADMSMITNLIDYKFGGNKVLMNADTVEESVEIYKNNIYEINSPEDIPLYDAKIDGHTELIIDGNVPPLAILDVITN